MRSAKAAQRVMTSVVNYVENKLNLSINRIESKCSPLVQSAFLGFHINRRG